MRTARRVVLATFGIAVLLGPAACANSNSAGDPNPSSSTKDLEVFTWWSSGGEQQGLNGLVRAFRKDCPEYEFINGAVVGGAGAQAKKTLANRLQQNDPPDTFQVHAGAELTDYISANQVEDLSALYAEWGLSSSFPKGLINDLSVEGKIYSVPANIHRANVVWANKTLLSNAGITASPQTVDELIVDLDKLKASGVATPLAVGKDWTQAMLFEAVLISYLGTERFAGLWKGTTDWNIPDVDKGIAAYLKLIGYANANRETLDWTDAENLLVEGKAAFQVMGDWEAVDLESKGFKDYSHFVFPGNAGVFQWLADSFVLPKRAENPAGAKCWLRTLGSADGQKAFNTAKGSIPARSDANPVDYSAYQQSAINDWKTAKQVPSCAHGSACSIGLQSEFSKAVAGLSTSTDTNGLKSALAAAISKYVKKN